MINKVILMGRLTRDPELRYTQSNIPVASFSLAVERTHKSKDENAQTADFIDIVAWRNTAEFVSKYFTKGKMMAVVGSLQVRSWQDKEGNNRKTTEVIADEVSFCGDSKRADGNQQASGSALGSAIPFTPAANIPMQHHEQQTFSDGPQSQFSGFEEIIDDEELPF